MKRAVESSNWDSRHRADVHLVTGKVVTLVTEWKPGHWNEVETRRQVLVAEARKRAVTLYEKFGIECAEIRVVREDRRTERVTETTVRETFVSEHFVTPTENGDN